MAILFDTGIFSVVASGGGVGAGWKLAFYTTGTTTPRNTYPTAADATAGTNPNTNPVVADANGRFPAMWLADASYKVILKTNTDVVKTTRDPAVDPFQSDIAGSGGAAKIGFLQAGTGAVARSVESKLRDTVSPEDFGAVSNGTTDDRAAIALADAAGAFVFTAGAYKIASNLTIANNVRFEPGASIVVPTGVTVTFSGYVDAWVAQIFQCSGTGKVVLNAVRNKVGFPEWWGAKANDSTGSVPANNVLAIHAELAALQIIDLQGSDYFINATIKILYPNRHLRGVSSIYDSVYGTGATRLLMTDGTTDVLQVGPDANPGTIAQFIEGVKVTGIAVARTVAPVVASACSAIRAQFILESYFEDVRGDESMIGWTFNGVVHAIVNRCSAKRTSAGTGGTDSWKGFYALGASGVGAGGNASLYISYSHADDTRAVKTGGIGFYADGKFTDCFWIHCETVSSAVGMEVNGNSATSNDFGNTDMTIIHPVVDQFTVVGIYIHNMGASGSVSIIEPYCGPAPGATAAIYAFTNKGGAINVTGGQLVMGASTSAVGVIIEANGQKSGAVYINGTIISEATAGGVVLSDATNCRIMPIVQNDTITGGPAVKLNNACLANIIAPIVKGKASGSTYGIQVGGTTDARNEYNLTGIDSGTIAGGSGNKLVRNAVQIVATGLTGTNLASGVMT